MQTPAPGSSEAKAQFMLRLRARGIRDLAVLRALESVPRALFVPHRYADLAARDMALPIPCGQTMPDPFVAARLLEALALNNGMRVLEIGTGSGYCAALAARLAGEVLTIERFETLALAARARFEDQEIGNAAVIHGDGLDVGAGPGPFDRIVVHGVCEDAPERYLPLLAGEGMLVFGRASVRQEGAAAGLSRLMLVRAPSAPQAEEGEDAPAPPETFLCHARLRPLIAGLAAAL